jgi:hypothetical protein
MLVLDASSLQTTLIDVFMLHRINIIWTLIENILFS